VKQQKRARLIKEKHSARSRMVPFLPSGKIYRNSSNCPSDLAVCPLILPVRHPVKFMGSDSLLELAFATVRHSRFVKEIIEKYNEIKWWDWPDEKISRNRVFFETDLTQCQKK
jgi:hypothetical protein